MCIDNFLNTFTPEEVSRIRKRIVESPLPGLEAEREFYRFFESLRRSAELYSLVMFQGVKIVLIDRELNYVVIREENGEELKIDL